MQLVISMKSSRSIWLQETDGASSWRLSEHLEADQPQSRASTQGVVQGWWPTH